MNYVKTVCLCENILRHFNIKKYNFFLFQFVSYIYEYLILCYFPNICTILYFQSKLIFIINYAKIHNIYEYFMHTSDIRFILRI